MPSVLPLPAELANLDTLDKIVQWCSLPASVWKAFQDALGGLVSVRIFSQLPQSLWTSTVNGLRIPTTGGADRQPSPAESIQLALAWRVARQAFQMPDVDPLADPAPATAAQGASQAVVTATPTKKVKFSAVLDQLDETEINTMTQKELDQAYANHTEVTGAEPPSEAKPTPDQIAALKQRVVGRRECPYADFSVLTPFGRRLQKQMKASARSSQLRCMGGVLESLQVSALHAQVSSRCPWTEPEAVVTVAALEEYSDRIAKLNAKFPGTWHVVMQAEDRCRGEMFERYRRLLTKAAATGRLPMAIDFDGATPWTGVFIYAARDIDFSAQNFIARGGRFMSQQRAEEVNIPSGSKEALANATAANSSVPAPPAPPGLGLSRGAKRKRMQKEKLAQMEDSDWCKDRCRTSEEVGLDVCVQSGWQRASLLQGWPTCLSGTMQR